MRFIVAPDWLVAMPEDAALNAKTVLILYGYSISKTYYWGLRVKAGQIPPPNKCIQQGKRRVSSWTVGWVLDHMKRPEELRYK